MPLVRYFIFAGGMLIGLLFLCDWYFPTSRDALSAVTDNGVDRSIIRIHSNHKWPGAIRFDTNAPIPTAPALVAAEAFDPPAEHVRQVYAMAPAPPQREAQKIRRPAKPPRTALREIRRRVAIYKSPPPSGWPPIGW
jgi:hypothetical protein